MEHFIATLVLPLFMVILLAAVMNVRPEAALIPIFGFLGVAFKLFLDVLLILVRLIGGAAVAFIARLLNAR